MPEAPPRRAFASAVASLLGVTERQDAVEANARAAKLVKNLDLYIGILRN
jgi:hypothetical protein